MKRALLCLAIALAGCAHTTRADTIKAALVSAEAVDAGYRAARGPLEIAYVKAAKSEADATARLATYQAKREDVDRALVALFDAIAIAATLNDDQSLAAMIAAGVQLQRLVTELEGIK